MTTLEKKVSSGKAFANNGTNQLIMMMKFLNFCILFCLLSCTASAQNSRLQAGLNFANVSITDDGKVDDAKMLTSFHVGLITALELSEFLYLQSGVVFTGKGSKTQKGTVGSANYSKATSNPYYIEVPLNLLFKIPLSGGKRTSETRFFIGAGPYLAVGVGGKMTNEGSILGVGYNNERSIEFSGDDPTTLDYEEGAGFGILKRFDYGLNGTAGIEGRSIVLAINYGLGLAKLHSGSNSSADHNNKHRVLSVGVGFRL